MPIINQVVKGGGGSAPAHYIEKTVDSNGKLINSSYVIDLTGVTNVGDYVLSSTYNQNNVISGAVDMSDLTTISGSSACLSMFTNCTGITSVDLSALTTVSGSNACQNMFSGCTGLTSVDLSSLTTLSAPNACQYMFNGCTGLTSVDLSSLTTLSNTATCRYMFQNCTGLTSVDISSLTTISGDFVCIYMFQKCTNLTSVNLSSLTTIGGQESCKGMFIDCGLASVYLKSLKRIENYSARSTPVSQMFGKCPVVDLRNLQYAGDYTIDSLCYLNDTLSSINLNSLEHIGKEGARTLLYLTTPSSSLSEIKFPMLTSFGSNPFYSNAFTGRTNLTIHFRKDMQSTVEALPNYATLWGAGTGSSAVFDLVGTLTGADSNAYTRSEKDSVYASETAGAAKTATAWKYNDTIYYTTGSTEPQIGDTIYSDSACTTAVTTVDSIA